MGSRGRGGEGRGGIFPFLAIAVPQKLILAGTTLEFCVTTLSFLGYLLISAKIKCIILAEITYVISELRHYGLVTALRPNYSITT
ncbi:hypothetical protein GLOIN_2v1724449 [Rhizophagus irregularis DAOM 181602=DAOM 197198]|nr:hypothetical protein GLOIN_2v1724449 [Rhizophagus irregularis DAOM 181602=DAOM 197198]